MNVYKEYNFMEPLLQNINREYITHTKHESKQRFLILEKVLFKIVQRLKTNNKKVFKNLSIFYSGSYFDGLRIDAPTKFDLCLILQPPKNTTMDIVYNSGVNGYVHLMCSKSKLSSDRGWNKFIDDRGFIMESGLCHWMQSELATALNDLDFKIFHKKRYIQLNLATAGSAINVIINDSFKGKEFTVSVDLVPCIEIKNVCWKELVREGFHRYPAPESFFVVPKGLNNYIDKDLYWRLCFHGKERQLLHNKSQLKPVVKLLKKLRDQQNFKFLKSYFLKNIALLELKNDPDKMWTKSLSYFFVHMLCVLQYYLEKACIPSYWNKGDNLLPQEDREISKNAARYLKKLIAEIDESSDPFAFAKALVGEGGYWEVKKHVHISKKIRKRYNLELK